MNNIKRIIREMTEAQLCQHPLVPNETCKRRHPLGRLKDLVQRILNFFDFQIIRTGSLDHMYQLQTLLLWNQPFALYFMEYPDAVDKTYALLSEKESIHALDRYIKFRLSFSFFIGKNELFRLEALDTNLIVAKYQDALKQQALPSLSGLTKEIRDVVLAQTFCAQQYNITDFNLIQEGDIIIDAGCLLGETAIYFAQKTGKYGKVFAFEPITSLAEQATYNIAVNGQQEVVTIVPAGVWDTSTTASFTLSDLGSSKNQTGVEKEEVQLVTIDSFVAGSTTRIDVIKMDIEGAELKALHGSINTIKEHLPVLMICLYHTPTDIVDIPQFIDKLNLGYSFFIRDSSDVVLFAIPQKRMNK